MDIKKKYFELIKKKADEAYLLNKDKLHSVALLFYECMKNDGIIQLFGTGHNEEFVNELNYRAGGIAYYHALAAKDLMLYGKIKEEDYYSGEVYNDINLIDKFNELYQMDNRDYFCLISFKGNEPAMLGIAARAKANKQKVIAVVNKDSYEGNLLDYADEYIDIGATKEDIALHLGETPIGQTSSTVADILAQALTAELYSLFKENDEDAPVLLSANIKGADVHNNSLTNPYERRIR